MKFLPTLTSIVPYMTDSMCSVLLLLYPISAGAAGVISKDLFHFHTKSSVVLMNHVKPCEFGVLTKPGHFHSPHRAVSLLCDNTFRNVLLFCILIIILISVEEHDKVCILLYGAGFSKVRQHGPMVCTLFWGSGELRKGNDR